MRSTRSRRRRRVFNGYRIRGGPVNAVVMRQYSKMKWELKQLEAAVRSAHGDSHGDAIRGPLQSFAWKSDMAYYHACEAERILNDAIAGTPGVAPDDADSIAASKAVLIAASPGKDGLTLRDACFKAEAHIIASAQAVHSLCDIICNAVYWAYRLDTFATAPPLNRLNLHSLLRTLNELPQYSNTASLVQKVVAAPEFKYLAAYVNTTKHRTLVNSSMSAAFDQDRGGMRIKAFSFTDRLGNTHTFEKKWARDFLLPENQTLRLQLVAVGNSLNDHFR